MSSPFHRFTTWFKGCINPKAAQHQKLADEVRERSAALNKALVEKKYQKEAKRGVGEGHTTVPSRWTKVTFGELRAYQVLSNTSDTAQQLPDRAWGLLNEAAAVFAADGKHLTNDDMQALESLLEEGADIANVTLSTLHEAFMTKSMAAESIRLNSMKVHGSQTTDVL